MILYYLNIESYQYTNPILSILTNYFTQETKNDVYERYTDTVVLSRYLYSIMDVKVSLLLSILEHDQEKLYFGDMNYTFQGFKKKLLNIC